MKRTRIALGAAMLASCTLIGSAVAQVAADGYRGGDRDRGRGGGYRTINCSSYGGYESCDVGGRIDGLRVSAPGCDLGRDWGVTPRSVWVDNGCRARFSISIRGGRYGRPGDPGYGGPGYGGGDVQYVSCASERNRYRFCPIRERFSDVRLVDRRSNAYCREGRDWGVNRGEGIWVRNGCRAVFSYRRGGRGRRR